MKIFKGAACAVISAVFFLMLLSMSACAAPDAAIRISWKGGESVAELTDSPTVKSLLAQLPATVKLDNFGSEEKIFSLSEKLSTQGAPKGYDPALGDITCYGPWGNAAIFYKDRGWADGLIPMGRITSGLEKLAALPPGTEIKIEKIR